MNPAKINGKFAANKNPKVIIAKTVEEIGLVKNHLRLGVHREMEIVRPAFVSAQHAVNGEKVQTLKFINGGAGSNGGEV